MRNPKLPKVINMDELETKPLNPHRILTLDGGGIKGIFTAVLLRRLNESVPGFLGRTHMFAGTSTGGILALALAAGKHPQQLINFYRDMGAKVFRDSWWDNLRDLKGLIGAEYDNKHLEKCLLGVFGEKKLKDVGPVLVPSYALSNGLRQARPRFFHNLKGSQDLELYCVDVALRTSAAPLLFPTHQGYIDGAVVANNPSMVALATALDPERAARNFEDVRLFSVGTGYSPYHIQGDRLDWGVLQWARPLVKLLMDGSSVMADYECRQILGGHQYFRLNPMLPDPVGLAAVRKINDLVRWAEDVDLGEATAWLQAAW